MVPTVIALLVLGRPVGFPCPAGEGHVLLGVGTQKVLTFEREPTRYLLDQPDVLGVEPLGHGQLLLIGAGEGIASLVVVGGGQRRKVVVDVQRQDQGTIICELCRMFPCGSTLTIRMVGDRIFLEGEASTFDEWKAARAALAKYPNVILNGRLKQSVIDQAFREANHKLEREGFGSRFVAVGNKAFLDEPKVPEERRGRLEELAAPLLGRLDEHLWRPEPLPRPSEGGFVPGPTGFVPASSESAAPGP